MQKVLPAGDHFFLQIWFDDFSTGWLAGGERCNCLQHALNVCSRAVNCNGGRRRDGFAHAFGCARVLYRLLPERNANSLGRAIPVGGLEWVAF